MDLIKLSQEDSTRGYIQSCCGYRFSTRIATTHFAMIPNVRLQERDLSKISTARSAALV
ncbi:hypothetical protein BGX21_008382, partial [Mortierella sp. AD011]